MSRCIRGARASASLKPVSSDSESLSFAVHPRRARLGLIEATQSPNLYRHHRNLHPRRARLGLIEAMTCRWIGPSSAPPHPRRARLGLIEDKQCCGPELETGSWMGLAHRAVTPLPSRHHLGPLLAVCPSTPPQPNISIGSVAFHQPQWAGLGSCVISRAQTWPARTPCAISADGLFPCWRRIRSAIDDAKD